VVEIGFIKHYVDARESYRYETLVNPEVAIDPQATEVHHITDQDVIGKPMFQHLADRLESGFANCDFLGYNVAFDLKVVKANMERVGKKWSYENARIIDPLRIWQVMSPRRLGNAVEVFCHREPTDSHRALGDAQDAEDVFIGQLQRWEKLPRNVRDIHELCNPVNHDWVDSTGKFMWRGSDAAFTFGKHSGVLLKDTPQSYLRWITENDFPEDVRGICRDALLGKFPAKTGV
jgi:DNA polymerase-3 subunit epsilon